MAALVSMERGLLKGHSPSDLKVFSGSSAACDYILAALSVFLDLLADETLWRTIAPYFVH